MEVTGPRYAEFVAVGDTSVEAQRVQWEAWRALTPQERVLLAASMSEDAREVTMAGIASRHPDLDRQQLVRALIRRVHGVDTESAQDTATNR